MSMLYIIVLRHLNSAGVLRNHRERILFKKGEFVSDIQNTSSSANLFFMNYKLFYKF